MRIILVCILKVTLVSFASSEGGSGPGTSACVWAGDSGTYCNMTQISADQIPKECTSIFFSGIEVDSTFNVSFSTQEAFLNNLLGSNKQVFLQYSPKAYEPGWIEKLTNASGNAINEMNSLKAFLGKYNGLAGLILNYLNPGIFPADFPDPTSSLITYLEAMKTTFPGFSVGMDIPVDLLIKYEANPKGIWFDFTKLDPHIGFYVVNLYAAIQCSPDSKCVGGCPLATVEKAMALLKQVNVQTSKCLIQYTILSSSGSSNADSCQLGSNMWCTQPENFKDNCIDTQASLFEKGKCAAAKASGFVVDNIEMDDPAGVCGCSRPFPALMALLDGFSGKTAPSCPKYDICTP